MDIETLRNQKTNDPKAALTSLIELSQKEKMSKSLAEFWLEFAKDEAVQNALGEKLLWALFDLVKDGNTFSTEFAVQFKLVEAFLRSLHQDPQTTFETLEAALMLDPNNEEVWEFLGELNASPEEAPVFEDGMDRIAEQVAAGTFPREAFDRLLIVLADPDDPEKYESAIETADGDE